MLQLRSACVCKGAARKQWRVSGSGVLRASRRSQIVGWIGQVGPGVWSFGVLRWGTRQLSAVF